MKRNSRFVRNTIIIIMLFLFLLFYVMVRGSFISWFLFVSFSILLAYSLLLYIYPLSTWTIERHLKRNNIESGYDVEIELVLRRRFPMPIFLFVCEEVLPASLTKLDKKLAKYDDLQHPFLERKDQEIKSLHF